MSKSTRKLAEAKANRTGKPKPDPVVEDERLAKAAADDHRTIETRRKDAVVESAFAAGCWACHDALEDVAAAIERLLNDYPDESTVKAAIYQAHGRELIPLNAEGWIEEAIGEFRWIVRCIEIVTNNLGNANCLPYRAGWPKAMAAALEEHAGKPLAQLRKLLPNAFARFAPAKGAK